MQHIASLAQRMASAWKLTSSSRKLTSFYGEKHEVFLTYCKRTFSPGTMFSATNSLVYICVEEQT